MVRRHDLSDKSSSQGQSQGQAPNHSRNHTQNKPQNPGHGQYQVQQHYQGQGAKNQGSGQSQKSQHGQQHEPPAHTRENGSGRSFYRDRDSLPRQTSIPKYSGRARIEETIEDIKEDIISIEKEIELEIKEIKSLKL